MSDNRNPGNVMIKLKNSLLRRSEGATIIEFALVAPVFFLIFVGLLEFSLIFFTYSVLEGAAARGSRVGLTGYAGANNNRAAHIRSEIFRLSGGYLDPARLKITMLSYNAFSSIGKPEPCRTATCGAGQAGRDYDDINRNGRWDQDQGRTGAGDGGEIVLYKLEYPWKYFTPLMGTVTGSSELLITSVATVKNEGF